MSRETRRVVLGVCLVLGMIGGRAGTAWAAEQPATPATAPQTALERMNLYRRLVGVAPLRLNAALTRAASNHAAYYVRNYGDPRLSGLGLHNEQPGKPGYTGATMQARIGAAGFGGTWNEGITTLGNPAAAVDSFMAVVNHRLPILDPAYTDLGYGGNASGRARIDVFTYGGQGKRPAAPLFIAYPPEGMIGVPRTYSGLETNAAFPGAHYPVGTAITLKYTGPGALALSRAVIAGPDGRALPVLSRFSYNFITRNVLVFAATRPLAAGTRYNLRVEGTAGGQPFVRAWAFTTGAR